MPSGGLILRPNWVEISRRALLANLQAMRQRLPASTEICAVVKADAYGHGAIACAEVLAQAGVPWFAVTSTEEGLRLRSFGLRQRILVLGGFTRDDAPELVAGALTPAVWDSQQLAWLRAALGPLPAAPFPFHLMLDTGMGRLGLTEEQEEAFFEALQAAPRSLHVEALCSHLHSAEAGENGPSADQLAALQRAQRRWGARLAHLDGPQASAAISQRWHLLNSAASLLYPQWGGTLARVGLSLYGYSLLPEPALAPPATLTPVLSWKTRVIGLKQLPAGHGVGYGSRYRTQAPAHIATLATGYADGYRRSFAGRPGLAAAHVILRGQRAPVVGNISMDLVTVDVTAIAGVALGDEVTLLGPPSSGAPTAAQLAELDRTIVYEVLTGIGARVERRYVD